MRILGINLSGIIDCRTPVTGGEEVQSLSLQGVVAIK